MNNICRCCSQSLSPDEVRIGYIGDEISYIGKRWKTSDFWIWKGECTKYCLPKNALIGKWEDRKQLFKQKNRRNEWNIKYKK